MPRSKTDKTFREAVERMFQVLAERLRQKGKNPASEIARTLSVSKQTAYQYLQGKAVPGSDRLAKAVRHWNLRLDLEGYNFSASAFGPDSGEDQGPVQQILLDLRSGSSRPIEIPLPGTGCDLRIGVKQETMEVTISLRRSA